MVEREPRQIFTMDDCRKSRCRFACRCDIDVDSGLARRESDIAGANDATDVASDVRCGFQRRNENGTVIQGMDRMAAGRIEARDHAIPRWRYVKCGALTALALPF